MNKTSYLGQTEICDLHTIGGRGGDENVLQFEISVGDVLSVKVANTVSNLVELNLHLHLGPHSGPIPAAIDLVEQVAPLDELHDKDHPVHCKDHFLDLDQTGMIQTPLDVHLFHHVLRLGILTVPVLGLDHLESHGLHFLVVVPVLEGLHDLQTVEITTMTRQGRYHFIILSPPLWNRCPGSH